MSATVLQPPITARSGSSKIEIRETRCKTLLHLLNYGGSTGYTVNLYKGCTHGCIYCYAPSLTHDERRWGTYVDVKVNAAEVLARELRGARKDKVFLSSASDPYQPVEARYKVTQRCLKVLLRNDFPVSVLTRSPLILRDLPILTQFRHLRVGMSITSVPVREFEPGVPPLGRRIDTLRALSKAEIETWVSLAPVIPRLVMLDLDKLFYDLQEAGVSSVSFGILRFTGYEESKALFEATSGIRAESVLEGTDEMVARLSDLVRRYGMSPMHDSPWKPEENNSSLEAFF